MKGEEIYRFLASSPQNYTLRELASIFGYEKWQSLKRLFDRTSYLGFVKKKMRGNKYKYICHVSTEHFAVSRIKKQLGHEGRGMVGSNVRILEKDFSEMMQQLGIFDPDLQLEVHGVRWQSPNQRIVCDPTIHHHETYSWTYCNLTINIYEGRILAWISPGRYEKFGLNGERYADLCRFRDQKIRELLGYDAGYILQVIQADIHQDDYRFVFKGAWQGLNVVAGIVDEYKITMQQYGVVRSEHPIAPSSRRIKRTEVRLKNWAAVRDLSDPVVSSLYAHHDSIKALANLKSWGNHVLSQGAAISEAMATAIPAIVQIPEKIRTELGQNTNALRSVLDEGIEEIQQNIDILGEELGQSTNQNTNAIVEAIRYQTAATMQLQQEQIQQTAQQTGQLEEIRRTIESLHQEIISWKEVEREERIQILRELRSQGKSWRQIATELQISLSTVYEWYQRNSDKEFGQNTNAEGTLVQSEIADGKENTNRTRTKYERQGIREVDESLIQKIITLLRQLGGSTTQTIVDSVRRRRQLVSDHLEILAHLHVISKERIGRSKIWRLIS